MKDLSGNVLGKVSETKEPRVFNSNLVAIVLLVLIFLLLILFIGTPDIHDAIVKYLMK
jgi:hypothetical protein